MDYPECFCKRFGDIVSVLDVFRPAPPIEEIQNPELVKKNYRYWRFRTFYAMWVGYAFFYFTRKSFTFAMPVMQSELGLGKNDWSMVYLIEVKHYTMKQAGVCLFWFEWGGLFGSLAAGWASDIVFNGKRNQVNILFTAVILCLLCTFKVFDHSSPLLDSIFIFLFGFFIFGPQMLIGMAAAELSHKNATATATGFVGCFAYLGAAAAGGPLGAITQRWGWDVYLLTLFICGALGVLIMLPLWAIKTNPKEAVAV